MTTEDKSKLIAESPFGGCTINDKEKVFKYTVFGQQWAVEGLKYHSNWNWLIPVWIKFRDLPYLRIKEVLEHAEYMEYIQRAICQNETPSEAFEALVKGIIWYNSIKK